jgi:hypothetical protein
MQLQDHDDARIAADIYPLAVKQARDQAALQLALMALFIVLLVVARFPRHLAWGVGMITMDAVATAYDVRCGYGCGVPIRSRVIAAFRHGPDTRGATSETTLR